MRCCADTQLYPPAPPLVTLEPPRSLHAVASSCTNVSLHWEAPHGAYPADSFVVDMVSDLARLDGRPPASDKGATQTQLTVLDAHALVGGLQPGTGYVFWVAARNAAGVGAWSSGLEVTTRPADAPPRAPRAPVLGSSPRGDCSALRLQLPDEEQGAGCTAALSLALQYKSTSTRTWSIVKQHLLAGSSACSWHKLSRMLSGSSGHPWQRPDPPPPPRRRLAGHQCRGYDRLEPAAVPESLLHYSTRRQTLPTLLRFYRARRQRGDGRRPRPQGGIQLPPDRLQPGRQQRAERRGGASCGRHAGRLHRLAAGGAGDQLGVCPCGLERRHEPLPERRRVATAC